MIFGVLAPILWVLLGLFTIWFLFKAKTYHPLSLDDLALTWRLHKQKVECKSNRIKQLLRNNDNVVGFVCGCGFTFKQERLITQDVPKLTFIGSKPAGNTIKS